MVPIDTRGQDRSYETFRWFVDNLRESGRHYRHRQTSHRRSGSTRRNSFLPVVDRMTTGQPRRDARRRRAVAVTLATDSAAGSYHAAWPPASLHEEEART